MHKLLSANLSRLWKNKVFWLALLVMLVASVVNMLSGCRQATMDAASGFSYDLDHFFFYLAPTLGIFFAVYMSLFLGTEYSDGTVRNKVVIGHTRSSIYLANLLTCMIAALFTVVAWLIGGLAGIPKLDVLQMSTSGLIIYLLISVLFAAALTAIFTFIGMVTSNKAATAVVSILLFLGLLVCASMIYNCLSEPEFYSGIVITADGMQTGDPMPNPAYLTGTMRTIYDTILNILPTGQAILMANTKISRPILQIVSSTLITVIVSACGMAVFRKKDLK